MSINFEGKTGSELFNIADERIPKLGRLLSEAGQDIAANITKYEIEIPAGGRAIHQGKVLKRMLRDITEENEKLFVVYTTDGMIEVIKKNL